MWRIDWTKAISSILENKHTFSPLGKALVNITQVSVVGGGVLGFGCGVVATDNDAHHYDVGTNMIGGLFRGCFLGAFGAGMGFIWPISAPMATYYGISHMIARRNDPYFNPNLNSK